MTTIENELKELEQEAHEIHPRVLSEPLITEKHRLQEKEAKINSRIQELQKRVETQKKQSKDGLLERELIIELPDLRMAYGSNVIMLQQGTLGIDNIHWEKIPALEFSLKVRSGRKINIDLRKLFPYDTWQEIFRNPMKHRLLTLERGGAVLNNRLVPMWIDPQKQTIKDVVETQVVLPTLLAVMKV